MDPRSSTTRVANRAVLKVAVLAIFLTSSVRAQDPLVRLRQLVSREVADRVAATMEQARREGLPDRAIAARVLEGAAKGAADGRLVEAADRALAGLENARAALEAGGRVPAAVEIEAAAQAMELGVDGRAVASLAQSSPSGRSLAVPLAALAALVARGLPADRAVEAVRARLELRASDVEISRLPDRAAEFLAAGLDPARAGLALARERAGFDLPVFAIPVVAGPPPGIPPNAGEPSSVPGGRRSRPVPSGRP